MYKSKFHGVVVLIVTSPSTPSYALALYSDDDATLNDVREAMDTFEDTARSSRRVLGSAHPTTGWVEAALRNARAELHTREAFARR